MEHTIKVRGQKTIVAENFKDYHKQIDDIRLTLHPGEKLVVATKIIAIAVIIRVESPIIEIKVPQNGIERVGIASIFRKFNRKIHKLFNCKKGLK
ncbi:hypothetical protein EZS27_010032 [termite gut metagenome]|uniref:Uncharacterized protein n=1 Tax=termite gut metagenome TaxID=433724 RepID=A0A5J4S8K4_9ZZZZ